MAWNRLQGVRGGGDAASGTTRRRKTAWQASDCAAAAQPRIHLKRGVRSGRESKGGGTGRDRLRKGSMREVTEDSDCVISGSNYGTIEACEGVSRDAAILDSTEIGRG
ncbi:hypothetical protein CEXT_66781 [Caerostris extrusa]|uniref:Uncharacterized protein n=1 Tax=Caerostris extrusa TaxID=172846 RepID=A0AAV4ME89_CAEEX|nr:hypothetical protein CEXT_66781 [Caerostris extrusa]